MFRKKLCALLMLIGMLVPVVLPASAGAVSVIPCTGAVKQTDICKEAGKQGNPIIHAISVVIEILAIVIGFAAVVALVLGGIKITLSGGDPSAVKSGRDTVIYALIGIVVAIFAQAIVSFVLTKL